MKLVSWNVNGIRACLTKGFEERFSELQADIFCLQETKCSHSQVKLELPGYHQYWNYANRRGYSGTAVFCRQEPLSVSYGIGMEEHDKEGRVITLEFEDFYLVTVYTPNSQSELRRLSYRMEWERDFRLSSEASGKRPVVLCGDLNVAHQEIDLKNPKANRKNAGFTDEERQCFYHDAGGRLCGHISIFLSGCRGNVFLVASYRFKAREKNAGWRIDYFLVSPALTERLAGAGIHTEIMGSDHCPVELILSDR